MIKRITALILALFAILSCGCKKDEKDAIETVNSLVGDVNSQTRLSGEYQLSITFDKGAVLYYADGDVFWDRQEKSAYAEFDQTYLGASGMMKNYFSNGTMISEDSEKVSSSQKDSDALFAKFPYFSAFSYGDDCSGMTIGENNVGTTYTFYRKNNKEIFESLAGGDLYSLVFSIRDPQPEKTQYGDVECVYTVADGKLVSCRYEFDVKLFDTPAYVPGYTPSEDEYTIDLHISAKITYDSFGDGVLIEEFSGEIPSESSESSLESEEETSN